MKDSENLWLSVVIPVYNVENYLPQCLDSVLAQDCRGVEVILADDGSTDRSGEICDRYARENPELIRVHHGDNGGVGAARNIGLSLAKGEYVFFLDSDDHIHPEMFRSLRAKAEADDSDIITFGRALDRSGVIADPYVDPLPMDRIFCLRDTRQLFFIEPNPWGRIWKRSLFTDRGIHFPSRVWYEDIRTTIKLIALAKRVSAVPDVLYYYVERPNSIMRGGNLNRNREILDAFDDLLDWYQAQGLTETYEAELEALTVYHVLLAASVRVLRIDPKSELLGQFSAYTAKRFPNWKKNPYRKTWPKSKQLALFLVEHRCYRLLAALFRVK